MQSKQHIPDLFMWILDQLECNFPKLPIVFNTLITKLFTMLRHTLLLIYRNFKRYKSSFFINLTGLSTGLACVLLIYLWVNHELNVDKFLENDSQLYQVMQNLPTPNGIETTEHTPGLLAQALLEEMPEVKYATSVAPSSWFGRGLGFIAAKGDHLKATGQFVEERYFDIFSLNLILGDRKRIFGDKYAVLISEELAMKLFPDEENIIGKTLEWEDGWYDGLYHVSGIFEKLPRNSSVQFDLLFNYELYYEKRADNLEHWGNSNPHTFVVLNEGTDLEKFNDKIRDFRKLKYKELVGTKYLEHIGTLFLQRYSDRYLYNRFENGVQAGGRISYVRLFSIIALFILAIASINFMNLSTARASRRMKEIGIKKVVGSDRKALVFQFLGESVLMALLSLGLAFQLVLLLLPEFNEITGKHLSLNFSSDFIISVLAIALVTGLLSGSYPALYLSGLRPAVVLKGKLAPSAGEAWIRKGLVVFQFVISVVLIVAVMVVFKQIEFIQTKNLGVNKDNIITFKKEGELRGYAETFLQQVSGMPEVINVTSSWHDLTGRHGSTGGLRWEGRDPDARIEFENLEISYDWIETMGVEMVAGRSFSREFGSDSAKIIFNEAAIAVMGLEDPIGKTVRLWGKKRQIIGVTKNFHFESLYEPVKPCFMQCVYIIESVPPIS